MKNRSEEYGRSEEILFPELFNFDECRAQGKDTPIVRTITFQVTESCNLRCFGKGTKILMSDFSYKNIEDIVVGDEVLAFDTNTESNKQLKLIPTKVTHTFHRHDFTRVIQSERNEVVTTDEHPFLSAHRQWIRAEKLIPNESKVLEFYNEYLDEVLIIRNTPTGNYEDVYNFETETHTYIANNFAVHNCTYCYQINKHQVNMTEETAKKFIDYLIANRHNKDAYVNEDNTVGLIIEFIGGEPFLNFDLIKFIVEYFEDWFVRHPESPWTLHHMYNYSSNGTLHKNKEIREFLDKYHTVFSEGITVDGCKACHDECRLFADGSGSYDYAMDAALTIMRKGQKGTKITLSPYNVKYIYESITNMYEHGFDIININCAYEEGWTLDSAKTIYHQFKKVADYIKENDIYDDIYVRMLSATEYQPASSGDIDNNFCGGTGAMIALQPSGKIYTCIRFMDTSLGNEVKDLPIGHIDHGIAITDEEKENIAFMATATIRSQSTKECLECPIGYGCSFCTGYNYQHFGEFKRATYICDCHKAAALATKYLSKIMRDKENYDLINIPEDWALKIIDKPEWDFISNYEGE